jgi:hypothetical protein
MPGAEWTRAGQGSAPSFGLGWLGTADMRACLYVPCGPYLCGPAREARAGRAAGPLANLVDEVYCLGVALPSPNLLRVSGVYTQDR